MQLQREPATGPALKELGGKANQKLIASELAESRETNGPKQEGMGGTPGVVWPVRESLVSWGTSLLTVSSPRTRTGI